MKSSYNPGDNRISGFGGIARNPRSSRLVLAALAAAGAMAWINRNGGFGQTMSQVRDKARGLGLGGRHQRASGDPLGKGDHVGGKDTGSQTGGATAFGSPAHSAGRADISGTLDAG